MVLTAAMIWGLTMGLLWSNGPFAIPPSCAVEPICPCLVQADLLRRCPTCCCQNSKNAVFYDATKERAACTACPALYNVTFYATWSGVCHADYYFNNSKWSPFSAVSHDYRYQVRWGRKRGDVMCGRGMRRGGKRG